MPRFPHTQVGFSRLAQVIQPTSGKPDVGGETGIRPREIAILRGLGSPLPAPPKKGTASATSRKRHPLTSRRERDGGRSSRPKRSRRKQEGKRGPEPTGGSTHVNPASPLPSPLKRGSTPKRNRLVLHFGDFAVTRSSLPSWPGFCPGHPRLFYFGLKAWMHRKSGLPDFRLVPAQVG
jgi:hypothetical protein